MFRDDDLTLRPLVPRAESREAGEVARLRERLAAGKDRPAVWVDEEALARAAEEARALVRGSYLVSERGEAFVAALPPGHFRLYRPGESYEETAASPQEALWALKRLWAARWSLDAVIDAGPGVGPSPRRCWSSGRDDRRNPGRGGRRPFAGGGASARKSSGT